MEKTAERDASGNVKYGDIGTFLRDAINVYFNGIHSEMKHQVYRSQLHHPERASKSQ